MGLFEEDRSECGAKSCESIYLDILTKNTCCRLGSLGASKST